MTRTPPRRCGFTLIELLVVISILGLLSALTVAGVTKVRNAQQAKATDATLTKLQLALDGQWKAVADECSRDRINGKLPAALVTHCDNDLDRAQSLWTYINLKREFPETFAEATTQINIPGAPAPRKTFATVSTSGAATDESAVLLFLALSEKGNQGVNSVIEDSTQGAQTTDGKYTVFKDSWGKPIRFRRFFQHTELDAPPYVKDKATNADPLDPQRKLYRWPDPADPSNTSKQSPKKDPAETALGIKFDSRNKMATVISTGPNGTLEPDPLGTTDDSYGYRLRRLGNKGD